MNNETVARIIKVRMDRLRKEAQAKYDDRMAAIQQAEDGMRQLLGADVSFTTATTSPASSFTGKRAAKPRSGPTLKQKMLEFIIRLNPGEKFTLPGIADKLGSTRNSLSAVTSMYWHSWPVSREFPGGGKVATYTRV